MQFDLKQEISTYILEYQRIVHNTIVNNINIELRWQISKNGWHDSGQVSSNLAVSYAIHKDTEIWKHKIEII